MFYDMHGSEIREGSKVEFAGEVYVITKINGDRMGVDSTSSLTFDEKPTVKELPCEGNVTLIEY